jgi:hypothetical protein
MVRKMLEEDAILNIGATDLFSSGAAMNFCISW